MAKDAGNSSGVIDEPEVPERLPVWDARLLIKVLVIILAVWASCLFLLGLAFKATLADRSGAVSSLFSALALVGVVYAIVLQRRELAIQRKDLALTRKELRRSAEAQEKSELALGEQARSLLAAARLNAAHSIAQAYRDLAGSGHAQNEKKAEAHHLSERYRQLMEVILTEMEGPSGDPFVDVYHIGPFPGRSFLKRLSRRARAKCETDPHLSFRPAITIVCDEIRLFLEQDFPLSWDARSRLETIVRHSRNMPGVSDLPLDQANQRCLSLLADLETMVS